MRQSDSRWRACAAAIVAAAVVLASGCGDSRKDGPAQIKPTDLTIVFSSDLLGRVRSCGCAEGDMGGLGRRATYTEQTRSSRPNILVVDAGDAMSADLSYSRSEADLTFESFNVIGLDAFAPGELELIYGLPYLMERAQSATFPFLAANLVGPSSSTQLFGPGFTLKEFPGGLKVAVVGVLDEEIRFPAYINRSTFSLVPAENALRDLIPRLERDSHLLVLLSHLGLDKSKALAQKFPGIDVVVVAHGKPVVKELEQIGRTIIVATGGEGQYMGRLDLTITGPHAYSEGELKLVALSEDIPLHTGITDLFSKYGVPLTDKEWKKAVKP